MAYQLIWVANNILYGTWQQAGPVSVLCISGERGHCSRMLESGFLSPSLLEQLTTYFCIQRWKKFLIGEVNFCHEDCDEDEMETSPAPQSCRDYHECMEWKVGDFSKVNNHLQWNLPLAEYQGTVHYFRYRKDSG